MKPYFSTLAFVFQDMKQPKVDIVRTNEQWQPYYSEPLTEEDARAITANMCAFVSLLAEWENKRIGQADSRTDPLEAA